MIYYVEFYGGDVRKLTQAQYIKALKKALIEDTSYIDTDPIGRRICIGMRTPWENDKTDIREELRRVKLGEDFGNPHGLNKNDKIKI